VAVAQVRHSCGCVSTGWGSFGYGWFVKLLTIAIEQWDSGHVFTIGPKRTHWRFSGLGESEAGREGVEREGERVHHCIDAVGAVRRN
jgi:hypothetical protein